MFRTGFRSDRFSAAWLGALVLATVLVLGGCSGSGDDTGAQAAEGSNSAAPGDSAESGADATKSASASPTPRPTPTAAAYKPASAEGPAENVPLPVMPELANQESKEGLEAFVRYWFALVNYGYETGNTDAVRTTSTTNCGHCNGYLGAIEKGYNGDDWIVGGMLDLRGVGTEFLKTPERRYQVVVSVMEAPSVYRGAGGVVYGEKPGSDYAFAQIIEASYEASSWKIELVDNLD